MVYRAFRLYFSESATRIIIQPCVKLSKVQQSWMRWKKDGLTSCFETAPGHREFAGRLNVECLLRPLVFEGVNIIFAQRSVPEPNFVNNSCENVVFPFTILSDSPWIVIGTEFPWNVAINDRFSVDVYYAGLAIVGKSNMYPFSGFR